MTSGVDKRILVILSVFTVLFGGLAIYILLHQSDGWKVAALIGALLGAFWVGALSVRFEVTASHVHYRSVFRKLSLSLNDITGIDVVSEFRKNSPQGVPKFYLRTKDGRREALNVRVLPIELVRKFCSLLKSKGVAVDVGDDLVAKRMAAQVFQP